MTMQNFDIGGLSNYQRQLFDAAPRDVFFAGLPQNLSFNQRQFFESQYQPIFSNFLGQNVRRVAAGQDAMPFLDDMYMLFDQPITDWYMIGVRFGMFWSLVFEMSL